MASTYLSDTLATLACSWPIVNGSDIRKLQSLACGKLQLDDGTSYILGGCLWALAWA